MTMELALKPEELAIVKAILEQHLPEGFRVFVFGSRATGIRLKLWSDLDLAIDGPGPLSFSVLGRLNESFDEALVPWKVDVIDLNCVSPNFRRIVDAQKVPLP